MARNLGDSGTKNKAKSWNAPGTAPSPSIQRQLPGRSCTRASTRAATTWPPVMHMVFTAMSHPRSRERALSARYTGVTALEAPMAKPTTNLPRRSTHSDGARPRTAQPTTKIADAMASAGRRPRALAMLAPSSELISAPSVVAATTSSWSVSESRSSSAIFRIAPEMTPVSYPNCRPDSAAALTTAASAAHSVGPRSRSPAGPRMSAFTIAPGRGAAQGRGSVRAVGLGLRVSVFAVAD
mmetsp:Transcript_13112/g.50149  ORF Transcript_13112/g.50149 Transcript_13112/m.50149 type:complete len:239 (+) Transcript_13112:653-1369(+)